MKCLLMFMLALVGGCTPVPDRLGIGATIDAETREVKTYQVNLFWNLRSEK